MFKSVLDWLTGFEPINRWVLILILAGMVAAIAFALKNASKKIPEGEK